MLRLVGNYWIYDEIYWWFLTNPGFPKPSENQFQSHMFCFIYNVYWILQVIIKWDEGQDGMEESILNKICIESSDKSSFIQKNKKIQKLYFWAHWLLFGI